MGEVDRLRELHDSYVWQVNAAVGEDRLDLVWQLADDYLDEALRLMSEGEPADCGRPGCAVCGRQPPAPGPPPRRRWLRRTRRRPLG